MVRGLEEFRKHFAGYSDHYVLIGGTACAIVMKEVGLEFRSTKDLDIVLHVEALNNDFAIAFWNFVAEGRYQNQQRSTGKDVFYRFYSPENPNFPVMLELFSRQPDSVSLKGDSHLTPIPIDESIMSLSAILMNEDYYQFTYSGKQNIGGISVVEASHLIPLKARAWLDLTNGKLSGAKVDEKDIRKHKNDILRLYKLLTPSSRIPIPDSVKNDLKLFLNQVKSESANTNSSGANQKSYDEVLDHLRLIYGL